MKCLTRHVVQLTISADGSRINYLPHYMYQLRYPDPLVSSILDHCTSYMQNILLNENRISAYRTHNHIQTSHKICRTHNRLRLKISGLYGIEGEIYTSDSIFQFLVGVERPPASVILSGHITPSFMHPSRL